MKKQMYIFKILAFLTISGLLIVGCSETKSENAETDKNEISRKADSISKVLEKFNKTPAEESETGTEEISESENEKHEFAGKPDTIVIEFDANNRLLIPGMLPSAYADENPTSDMYVKYSDLQKEDKISFTLSEISGIDGNIEGNELFFETEKDFEIISVNCNAYAGVFFNEDGSGGVWQEFEDTEYGKEPAKQTEEKVYKVPLFEGAVDIVPNEIIEKADRKTEENDLLSYEIYLSKITVEIQYLLKGKKYKKTLVFNYQYGD